MLTMQMATSTVEYLPTSRILRTFPDRVLDLTCLVIDEKIDSLAFPTPSLAFLLGALFVRHTPQGRTSIYYYAS